jgi:hypothetical protein
VLPSRWLSPRGPSSVMPSGAPQVNLWVLLHSILSNKISKGKGVLAGIDLILAGIDLQVSHAALPAMPG